MQIGDAEKQKSLDVAEDSREAEWQYVSFLAEIFKGNFRWDLISPFPTQSAEDKKLGDEFLEKVKGVMEKYIDPDVIDRNEELSQEAINALAEIGCFGIKIPKEYGGLGFSQTNYARVMAYISSYCQSTAAWLSAHQSIGVPQPLKLCGTKEQKEKYLPLIAKGAVTGFCLTEPGVGSDPARMVTTAVPTEDGKHYILNGEKMWITNGPSADLLIVMAMTPPKIVKGREKKQITAFIVETKWEGFEVAHKCHFMGIRGISNGLLRFNNMKVPVENMLGEPGSGLKVAFGTLNVGRLTIPATCAAGAKIGMMYAQDWSNKRRQWGARIGQHQATAKKLANMAADTFAVESVTMLTCANADLGNADIRLEAAMAKYYASEVGWRMTDDLLQVRGGRGFETAESLRARGEDPFPVERMLRDARIGRIVEGTSEIMQLFIAREAMDTHVSKIMPIMDPRTSIGDKVKALVNAVKFYTPWLPKQFVPALGCPETKYLSSRNRDHLKSIPRIAKKLARNLFFAMGRYQQKLEREQLIMACFVDVGTDLFAMSASLSNAERMLAENPNNKALQDAVDLFCRNARKRIADNFKAVSCNHNYMFNKVANHLLDGDYEFMYTDIHPNGFKPLRSADVADQEPPKKK